MCVGGGYTCVYRNTLCVWVRELKRRVRVASQNGKWLEWYVEKRPKYSEVQQITTKHSPAQHNSACHTLEAREEGGTVVASRERTHVKGEEPTDRLVTSNTRMYTSML